MLRATVPARHPMLTLPSSKRQANMVLGVLLCNWLLLVAATAVQAAAAGQPLRIVVFGDSLVAGFQLKASDAFPAQLERALKARGHAVEVINAGVSGDTTAAGLERLRWSIPEKVDAVILELGANDALRGLDPSRAKSNLDKMIATLKGTGAEVLLAGMLAPPNMGPQLRAGLQRHLPGPRHQARADPVSVLPRRHRARPALQPERWPAPQQQGRGRDHPQHPADGRAADGAGAHAAGGGQRRARGNAASVHGAGDSGGDAHASVAAACSAQRREMDRARGHAHHAALRRRHRRSHGRRVREPAGGDPCRAVPGHHPGRRQLRRTRAARAVGGRGGRRAAGGAVPRQRAGGACRRASRPTRATSSRT